VTIEGIPTEAKMDEKENKKLRYLSTNETQCKVLSEHGHLPISEAVIPGVAGSSTLQYFASTLQYKHLLDNTLHLFISHMIYFYSTICTIETVLNSTILYNSHQLSL
jgi:hypothetical protein